MKSKTTYVIGSLIVAASLVASPAVFAKGGGGKQGGSGGGQSYSQSQSGSEQTKKQQGVDKKQSQHQKQHQIQNQNRHTKGGGGQQATEPAVPAE